MDEDFRVPPTQDELASVDRSRVLTLVFHNATQTPKIDAVPDPCNDDGKHFHIIRAISSSHERNQYVSSDVFKVSDSESYVSRDVFKVSKRGSKHHVVDIGWDLWDQLNLCPDGEMMSVLFYTEKEIAWKQDSNGLVGRGFLPKIEKDSDGWYSFETFAQDVGEKWEKEVTDAGHSGLHCGYEWEGKKCSKQEQYGMREQAVFQLAIRALESPKLNLEEMMKEMEGVATENRRSITIYGQHVNGMYTALQEFMGDESEPWSKLEEEYGCMLVHKAASSGQKRLRT